MLIVEDGTCVTDAESYASVAFADKYFADRGAVDWSSLTVLDKERGLRRATDYIELRFASRFKGSPVSDTQSLSFPREVGVIPRNLQRACCEYAVRSLAAPLVADPLTDESGHAIKSKSEGLGPLKETTEYATEGRDLFKPYPAADNLLKSLLRNRGIIR